MTAAFFDSGATIEVGIAFGKNPLDSTIDADFTDVTAYVTSIDPTRGRASERDMFSTGSMRVVFDNRDGRFTPGNGSSPYSPNVIPMRPTRFRFTYAAVTYGVFRGFVGGFRQIWPDQSNATALVEVVAHDVFKVGATAILPESAWQIAVQADAPTAWYRLGEPVGAVAFDSAGTANGRFGPRPSTTTGGLPELSTDAARRVDDTTASGEPAVNSLAVVSGAAWSWEGWFASPALPASSSGGLWTQDTPITGLPLFSIQPNRPGAGTPQITVLAQGTTTATVSAASSSWFDGNRHHLVVTRAGTTLTVYVDAVNVGSSSALTAGDTNFGLNGRLVDFVPVAGVVVDEVAIYNGVALSAGQVLAHYTAGSTAHAGDTVDGRITRTLAASGMSTLPVSLESSLQTVRGVAWQGGNLLAYLQLLEVTEQGRLFVSKDGVLTFYARRHDMVNATIAAAFSDADVTLPYSAAEPEFDDSRVLNDVYASRAASSAVQQHSYDATSRSQFSLRSKTMPTTEGQSDIEVFDLTAYQVFRYKDPRERIVALTVVPRRAPATLLPVVGALEIGSKITVRRAPPGVTATTTTHTVEGVSHTLDVSGRWEVTYLLAPVDPASYLILDDPVFGKLDSNVLAY